MKNDYKTMVIDTPYKSEYVDIAKIITKSLADMLDKQILVAVVDTAELTHMNYPKNSTLIEIRVIE